MSLESKIKDLERKLAIKKAYLSMKVSFGNSKIEKDIKELVSNKITELARKLADEQEINTYVETLSKDEVNILKLLASKVIDRESPEKEPVKQKSTKNKDLKPEISKSNAKKHLTEEVLIQEARPNSKGILLFLDNVDRTLRSKIEPQSTVLITKIDKDQAFVATKNGVQFWVPLEDLEIIA